MTTVITLIAFSLLTEALLTGYLLWKAGKHHIPSVAERCYTLTGKMLLADQARVFGVSLGLGIALGLLVHM